MIIFTSSKLGKSINWQEKTTIDYTGEVTERNEKIRDGCSELDADFHN